MVSLSNEDREALAAGFTDWWASDLDPDDAEFARTNADALAVGFTYADGIAPAVEQIVARHVAAALNEAADRIDTAGSVCINAHGDQCVGGIAYRDAAGIVRKLVANDGP